MMNNKEYKEEREREYKYLDSLDLTPFLQQYTDIYEIMQDIEMAYNDKYGNGANNMFDCIDDCDFCEYLGDRYKCNTYEETHYYIGWLPEELLKNK